MEKTDLTSTNCNKYLSKQVKNLNKSLSKGERERDKGIIKMLLNHLDIFAEQWHSKPIIFSESEIQKLIKISVCIHSVYKLISWSKQKRA